MSTVFWILILMFSATVSIGAGLIAILIFAGVISEYRNKRRKR